MLHEVVQPRVGNRIRDGHRQRGAVVNHVHMEDIGACCLPDSSGPDRTSQLPLQGFLTSSHTRTMYNPSPEEPSADVPAFWIAKVMGNGRAHTNAFADRKTWNCQV
jgi:hypothetical protein